MEKSKILIHLDTDLTASAFDRIVAYDSGADHVLTYAGVRIEQAQNIVHGAIFTRGGADLANTAIFVGGSDIAAGESLLKELRKHLLPQFGLRVSLMLDSNGANTTAAAAVAAAARHMTLQSATALVLGGTGPVGQRTARLLARAGADVRLGSRQKDRAEFAAQAIRTQVIGAKVTAVSTATTTDAPAALAGAALVVAAGAAGAVVLPKKLRAGTTDLKVAIDLNAVPPAGIEGLDLADNGLERDGVICYGALGVGESKMKLHKAAIRQLFTRNDLVLDAEQIYDLFATLS